MHKNYRRKNKTDNRQGSRHGFSLAWYRSIAARRRRRTLRQLIFHEGYDRIPAKYPRDLLWYLL